MIQRACITILLIAHNTEDWMSFRQCLQQDDLYTYRILEFETATQAIAWCQEGKSDVILLNSPLFGDNCLDSLEKLRKIVSHTESAIILLTAHEDTATAVWAMKNGAQDYLVKPQLSPNRLQAAIHDAVNQRDKYRQLAQIQEQKQLISAIALRIRQSLKLKDILASTVAEVRQFLQADRVLIYRFHSDMSGTVVSESVLPGWTASLEAQIQDTCFQQGAGMEYRQGKTRAINNIYQAGLTDCHVQLLEQFEVKANLVVPILVLNRLWGLLIAHQCTAPRQWQAMELELLDQLAVQIAIAIQQASAYEIAQKQLRERYRVEKNLRDSEERFRSTFEQAAVGITHVSLSGKFLRVNQRFADITGYSPSELKTLRFQEITHPEDLAADLEQLEILLAGAISTYSMEKRYIRQDNTIIWVKLTVSLVRDTFAHPQYFIGVVEDISDRILAQQAIKQLNQELEARVERRTAALKESEERWQLALRGSNDGIWDWNLKTNELFFSARWKQIRGFSDDAISPDLAAWSSSIHPDDRDRILADLDDHFAQKTPFFQAEYRVQCQDGSYLWVLDRGQALWDEAGHVIRISGSETDITTRKQAEAQLFELLNLQQAILTSTDYAITSTNSQGIIQIFNPAAQKMLGYTAEEVVGQVTPVIFHDPEEIRQHAQALGEEIAPGQKLIATNPSAHQKEEWTFIRKDGSCFPVSLSVQPLCNAEGQIIGGVGIAKDITQQKQIDAQLRKNAANLAAAQRIAHLGSWEMDLHTQEILWSQEVFRIFGRNPESGMPTYGEMLEWIHPDDRHHQDLAVQQAIAQGQCYELEYRCYRPDQSLRYVLSRGEVILNADGQPSQLISIILDITDRKQTEQQLSNLSDRLTLALKSADIGTWDWDLTHDVYWDERMYALYELPYSDDCVKDKDWLKLIHPEDRDKTATALQDALQGKREFDVEFRTMRNNGSIRYIHASALVQRNQQGKAQRMVGINYDITERKQVESALRESEHRYATLTEAAPVAIFRLDHTGQCVYVNERWSRMTGRPIKSALGVGWLEALHPEDRDRLLTKWLQQGFSQPELYQNEGRHLLPDGSVNWFYCHILPETDSNGAIMGYIGTLTDITERKQAEEQLHHLSERLSLAIKSGGFGIWEYDCVNGSQIWDEQMYKLYGVSPIDFDPTLDSWLSCLHPDDRDYIVAVMDQVLQNNQEYDVEFSIIQPNGEIRYIKAYGLLNCDPQGQPLRMIGVNFDITAHKQAEQELIRNRDLREIIFNESADALFLVDPVTLITLDCNRRAVELFEATKKSDLLGIAGHQLQNRQFSSEEMATIVTQMRTKGFWSQEIEYVTCKGKVFWGNIAAKPIVIAGRTLNLLRVTDISEHKQAEEALAKYAREVEDLYNKAPCGYHSLDSAGRIMRVNETELQWLGYSHEEMIGQPFVHFFTEASRQAFLENYPRFKERGWSKDLEYEMVCKDGTILPVMISAAAVKDADGNYLYSRATLFDMREQQAALRDRQKAEQELQASRTMLQLVLDTIPQRVFWKDCQLNYIGCNPAFANDAQLFQPDDIIGKTDFDLPWKQQAPMYRADDTLVITTGKAKLGYEEPMATHDGASIWLRTSKIPLTNTTGEVIGVLGSYEDITERKYAEEKLRQTNEQLANANAELARATRLKDEFLANMSHELRTPLNAILGMSEGFEEGVFGAINDQQAKAIATIERSGRHLLELINDILDLSKIESGKLELQLSDIPIKSLCETSLVFIKQVALKKSIRLLTEIPHHLGSIQADDRRLRQVLINLLSNAVKFTPEGGTVTLKVWLEEPGEKECGGAGGGISCLSSQSSLKCQASPHINFCVTDTGIGISPENIGKLFQPFMQLDSSLNRQYNGTGLGLALVQRITTLHGGTVCVDSQLGKGSCFTVRIPYITTDILPPKLATVQLPKNYSLSPNSPVLIIEDSMAAADQITRYLLEMSIKCLVYPMGEGALEEVIRIRPALVILDLQLPNVSGWDVLKQLKLHPQTKDIPVLIVSVVDERTQGITEGAFAYLVKPITRTQFQATLERLKCSTNDESGMNNVTAKSALSSALVLLVEDNQANINTMSGYLESRGYRLAIANDGQQAIAQVYAQRPDLIVMDIQMPEMDGLTAIRRIREDEQFVDLPIIALTALAMPGDRETCLAAGANEYLTKPVKLKQLVATIQKFLTR
ncbi:PAS domain S-box protein [Nostoc sp. CMAA1605]|uniref:PAS domain S-box protein n=1 Tax=Nostoc sp. CMAA1605 TaxID=2055159 RepID=UPI001F1C8FB5|nr:PAS domain S-box protein [Nostoc sp. CMAA1605]MCF4965975.1 hypothetical protein [Nostoc sp. CMAA1605]